MTDTPCKELGRQLRCWNPTTVALEAPSQAKRGFAARSPCVVVEVHGGGALRGAVAAGEPMRRGAAFTTAVVPANGLTMEESGVAPAV